MFCLRIPQHAHLESYHANLIAHTFNCALSSPISFGYGEKPPSSIKEQHDSTTTTIVFLGMKPRASNNIDGAAAPPGNYFR